MTTTAQTYAARIHQMPTHTVDERNERDAVWQHVRALGLEGAVLMALRDQARREAEETARRDPPPRGVVSVVWADRHGDVMLATSTLLGVTRLTSVTWETLRAAATQADVEAATVYGRALAQAEAAAQ